MTQKKKVSNKPPMPMVSICTPTFNRRPFIPFMFECFRNFEYPKSRIEWIIVDDGTDKIQDLIESSNIPQIKYFPLEKKLSLGAKRNMLHDKSSGSIIINMDDDDYYPPERVKHAVETLMANPHALCAGSSEIYLYFKNIQTMYQFGPYGPNHATAATFAMRRALLDIARYDDKACIAEEREFLKDYSIPFVQLDPLKTILVFSHEHNSFDKRTLLKNPNQFTIKSDKTIEMFIKNQYEDKIKEFFMKDIDSQLKTYLPGDPSMKPDVLNQMKEIQETREKNAALMASQQQNQQQIMMHKPGEEPVYIGLVDAVNIINHQQQQMEQLMNRIKELETMVVDLQKEKITKQLGVKNISPPKNVIFSDNLVQPSVHVQKKQQSELQELKDQLDARKLIEQKLQSQIQTLIQKNKDLEIRLDKSKNSIKSAFESKPSSPPVSPNPTVDQKSVPSKNNFIPTKPKSKSDPEIDVSTFMKTSATTRPVETVRPAEPFSVTNNLPTPPPTPSYASYKSPFSTPVTAKKNSNSKLEPEINIRI